MQFNVSGYGMDAKQLETTHATRHNTLVIFNACRWCYWSHFLWPFQNFTFLNVDSMATGKQTISFGQIHWQWQIYIQKFPVHTLPPNRTKCFCFYICFHQKAPVSEVGAPSNEGWCPPNGKSWIFP